MLPALLKRLLIASNGAELTTQEVDPPPAKAVRFQYTFLGEDGLLKGGVVLAHQTNTYSSFSLSGFGLVPVTSPESVLWQDPSGEVLIDFKVSFAEGDEVDSLKGTLTLLDCLLKKQQGRWIACVRSSGLEVARVRGTWLRCKV
jgi:hypothetical protein